MPGAQEVSFDDSQWETVSTPHSFNDVDSFRVIIDHSGGDRGTYKGLSWYRKHFKLPAEAAGSKVFIEFEGMRQAGDIYFNGKPFGLYENGITGYGVDITSAALFGDQDNVLAVEVDNRTSYKERATDTTYQMERQRFQPRPRRDQPAGVAAPHGEDLPDPAAVLRPEDRPARISTAAITTSRAIAATSQSNRRFTMPRPIGRVPQANVTLSCRGRG